MKTGKVFFNIYEPALRLVVLTKDGTRELKLPLVNVSVTLSTDKQSLAICVEPLIKGHTINGVQTVVSIGIIAQAVDLERIN